MGVDARQVKLLEDMRGNYLAKLLIDVGRWHVYSAETLEHRTAIEVMADANWISIRDHYGEMFPDGIRAYELTERGLDKLEEMCDRAAAKAGAKKGFGAKMADQALEDRDFYREHAAKDTWKAARAATLEREAKKRGETLPVDTD